MSNPHIPPSEKSDEDKEVAKRRADMHKAFKAIDWLAHAELRAYQAQDMQIKFQAARKNGFTDAQALHLCNKTWEM